MKNMMRKIKRALGPKSIKKLEVTGEILPRRSRGGRIACRRFDGLDLSEIDQKMEAVKDQFFQGFHSNYRVLIKVNVETANPYPASTDLAMLEWVIGLLKERGIHRIVIGDCSSQTEVPTRKAMKEAGFFARFGDQVEYACFDELEWVRVKGEFSALSDLVVPRLVDQVDKIIYLANLNTHRYADFSMGMKLAVGFMHPLQRIDLHRDHLHEKIVEIAAAVQPDLIFLDGRNARIDQGVNTSRVERGDCVIVGSELLQTERLGYEVLLEMKKKFQCVGSFTEDPFEMKQLRVAKDFFYRQEGISAREK